MALEEIYICSCCEVCSSLMLLYGSGGDMSDIVVKFAFLYCCSLLHLFIIKYASLQYSCMALEDTSLLFL